MTLLSIMTLYVIDDLPVRPSTVPDMIALLQTMWVLSEYFAVYSFSSFKLMEAIPSSNFYFIFVICFVFSFSFSFSFSFPLLFFIFSFFIFSLFSPCYLLSFILYL